MSRSRGYLPLSLEQRKPKKKEKGKQMLDQKEVLDVQSSPFPVNPFILTFLTCDPKIARYADLAGIERVGVDLEVLGKAERQKGLSTWISHHREEHIPALREVVSQAKLFARTNPLNPNSAGEVNRLLNMGVEVLMLPMFTTADEVTEFVNLVGGRAKVVPLLETLLAAERIEQIVAVEGIDEIHVGINDLGLSMGIGNRFVTLTTNLMERVGTCIRESGMRFGFGSIGRALDTSLPISSDLVYAQYPRLGGTAAIISQKFLSANMSEADFCSGIAKSRARMAYWFSRRPEELDVAYRALCETLQCITPK